MNLLPRLPVRALAAAVLAVAGLAVVPAGAAASCGDYVQIVADHQPTPQPASPAAPCPGCSKAPATPILPISVPVRSPSESEQSVALTTPAAGAHPLPGWARSTATSPHPVRLTSSIFHPPRIG